RHITEIYGYLADVLATRTTSEWLTLFEEADLPAAPMYSLDDVLADPHLATIGYFREVEHPTEGTLVQSAISTEWSDSIPVISRHAPNHGEHTREVLREAGVDDERIEMLLHEGAVREFVRGE